MFIQGDNKKQFIGRPSHPSSAASRLWVLLRQVHEQAAFTKLATAINQARRSKKKMTRRTLAFFVSFSFFSDFALLMAFSRA